MSPRALFSLESPDEAAPVLVVSPYGEDHIRLPEILHDSHWEWHGAAHCRQALRLLGKREIAVVICECDQPDGSWRDLLHAGVKTAEPPNLIVCSRLADEYLWSEVLNLGGHDVLSKPFDAEEVMRVAFLAWLGWKRGEANLTKTPSVRRYKQTNQA